MTARPVYLRGYPPLRLAVDPVALLLEDRRTEG